MAFTDKFMSISTVSESPAAIKAMVDRAAERGWGTVRLDGSPEFVRQGWIAAAAQGLTAVGHTVTAADREAAAKERTRLQVGHAGPAPQRPGEAVGRVQSDHGEQVSRDRTTAALGGQRQLAAAIEKALVDGKVSPELRGQVRAMMAAEGAERIARGERFKVPVYDARAPRAQAKTVLAGPQRTCSVTGSTHRRAVSACLQAWWPQTRPLLISGGEGAARTAQLVGQGSALEPFIATGLPASEIVKDVGGGERKPRAQAQAQAAPVF